jgi:dipeptidyl aminopeptidase/acylaminoacyl peptidase
MRLAQFACVSFGLNPNPDPNMKPMPIVTLIVLSLAPAPSIGQSPAKKPLTAEDVITLPRVGDPQPSPDGTLVAYSVGEPGFESNRAPRHVWVVAADGSSEPRQITKGDGESDPRWSPDGSTIAYVARKDGVPQIHLANADGSGARALTSLSTGAGGPVWSPDGTKIAFTSEVWPGLADDAAQKAKADEIEKSGVKALVFTGLLYRHWDHYTAGKRTQIFAADVKDGKTVQLTRDERDAPPFSLGGPPDYAFSPDGTKLYFTRGPAADRESWSTNADLCVVPSGGGDVTNLTANNLGWDGSPAPSPDGRWVAFRSQAREGYESDLFRLMLLDAKTGAISRIFPQLDDSVDELLWGPKGNELLVSVEEAGSHAWYEATIDPPALKKAWSGKNATSAALSRNGKTLAAVHASLVDAPEIHRFDMAGGALTRLTSHTLPVLKERNLPSRESFTWKGGLDATVQGWIVKPPGFDERKTYPMIVFIHGGPQGAWMDAWSTRWNPAIYASAGYVVFAPNPHGSTGFGHPFCEQISGDWGGAVYEDIRRGVDAVIALGYVDASRMGAAGGSYGGYMVNWILGHDHRFKALVSHAGVYDLESMYGATEELWFPEWEFRGPPWENRELYEKWSPHRYAAAFKTPTLVIHGELDYRVPVTQGFELFTALQRQGVPSKFLYYPDEGHWVLKPRNGRLWNQTVMEWFDRWLKPAPR